MKKISLTVFLFITCLLQAQMDVAGVKVPFVFKTDEAVLIVNGAGTRVKYMMTMYVGALFVKVKSTDAQKLIDADEAMCMRLNMVSGLITSEKMTQATDEGFKKSTNENTSALQARIDQFKAVFAEKINKGDVYDLVYQKAKGTLVYKNNKLAATIPGLDFKKALFGIWLCTKPADTDLKEALLGE